jgi:hypothetical protein
MVTIDFLHLRLPCWHGYLFHGTNNGETAQAIESEVLSSKIYRPARMARSRGALSLSL